MVKGAHDLLIYSYMNKRRHNSTPWRGLRCQIQQAIGPMRFSTPVSEIPPEEFTDSVQAWQP